MSDAKRPTCKTCKYADDHHIIDERCGFEEIVCRFNPPTPVVFVAGDGSAIREANWPVIPSDLWCGKHEEAGEKKSS